MNRAPLSAMRSLTARLFGGPANTVFRGMATLALGTGAARLIGIASIPILTRIYSPADYGFLSIFTALVSMIVPVLTLRYVVAIPLPRHDGMAMNLLALSAALMLVMTVAISIGLWFFGPALLGLVSMDVLVPYWWLIALGIVGTGSYELLSMWATRRKAYRIVAQTQVFQSAVGALFKISLGLLAIKPLGLLLGQIVAQSGGIGSFITRFQMDFRRTAKMVSLKRMGFVFRYYRGFPAYRLPSQFLLVFSMQAPLIFITAIYDVETTGQFGLALMALGLPISLIGQSIGNAYYAEIAQLSRKEPQKILEITKSVQKRLFVLGLPPTLFIFFFGKELFEWIFGNHWSMSGSFASIVSVYLFLQLTSAPLIQVLNVFNVQKMFLAINASRAMLLILVFLFFRVASFSSINFVTLYSCMMVIFYFSISYLIIRFLMIEAAKKAL